MDTPSSDEKSLLEREPIVETFRRPANVKILTVLNDAGSSALTVSEIVEQTDISRQAFYDNKDILLKYGLIEEAEKAGNATRYAVDLASDEVQAFMELRDTLIDAAGE